MLNINSSLINELREKKYRDAYVASQIRISIPFQIRGLRKSRGWNQEFLANEARMAQPRISEMEKPGERRLTIETLLRIASAFDVALQVRFVPFSQIIEDDKSFDPDNFEIKTFETEINELAEAALVRIQDNAKVKDYAGMNPSERLKEILSPESSKANDVVDFQEYLRAKEQSKEKLGELELLRMVGQK